MKKFLLFLFMAVISIAVSAQLPDSGRIVITDKGDRIEVQSGDTVFEISYDAMYADYLQKGVDLANNGDFEKAISNFNLALLYRTNEPQVYYNRGLALHNLKRYSEAIGDFTTAISLDSLYEEAYSQRGISLCQSDRVEEALPDFLKAVAIHPEKGMTHYNLGIAYLQASLPAEACESLQKALDLGYSRAATVMDSYCR